jgi:hypothetical protein
LTITGFVRIRHFGFFANRCQKEKLARIRTYMEQTEIATAGESDDSERNRPQINEIPTAFCPRCHQGRLIALDEIVPRRTAYGGMKNG